MKLRIKGNSIRLRLTKTEIIDFGEHGMIEERTDFPNGSFLLYTLEGRKGIDQLGAEFSENKLTVYVPMAILKHWTTTDEVGFNTKINTGAGKELFLLIEKDWVCLDNTFEDQRDNFPNPNAVC